MGPTLDLVDEDLVGSGFDTMFTIASVVIALVFVAVVVLLVKNVRKARAHGLDPLTMQTDLAARVMASDLLTPAGSPAPPLRERLAELEALHRDGVISDEEYDRARRSALGG